MDMHELMYFTGKCLVMDDYPDKRAQIYRQFSEESVPIRKFIYFCDRHLALPAVYSKLVRNGMIDFFPPALSSHLKGVYSANSDRNKAIISQVFEIHTLLRQHGIEHVYLKGAAHLLDGLYEECGERLLGDIDLLVEKKNYIRAADVLMANGYENPSRLYDEVIRKKHYYPLIREGMQAYVEIHQAVSMKHEDILSSEDIFRGKKAVSGYESLYVPSDHHKVIHNVIHSRLINGAWLQRQPSLREIYDLYLLSKRSSLVKALDGIKGKREKAGGYYLFSASVLDLDSRMYSTSDTKAQRYCRLHEAALKHPGVLRAYRKVLEIMNLLFKSYFSRIIKSLYQKSSRKYLFSRLSSLWWYKAHFTKLKEKFF